MNKATIATVLGAVFLVPVLIVVFFVAASYNAPTEEDSSGGYSQAGLKTGTVPPEFEPWVIKAGKRCPEISAPVIAAQIEVESGWDPEAVSPAGAGPARGRGASAPARRSTRGGTRARRP